MPNPSIKIGFVLFDQLTQLDLMGPLQVLSRVPGAEPYFAAKTLNRIGTDCGISLNPTVTLQNCPDLDVLCVPGGYGINEIIHDQEVLEFVRSKAKKARYITSVCTGAFVLGVAGLIRGRKATTHWRYHYALPRVGAIPVQSRVVRDGSLFTGGGVTAGIDFAFLIAEELAGSEIAAQIQLSLEYDPAPPAIGGTPRKAETTVVRNLEFQIAPNMRLFDQALKRATLNNSNIAS